LEGRERNGRHHEFGCPSWNRSRGAETERTGGRTARHCVWSERDTWKTRSYQRSMLVTESWIRAVSAGGLLFRGLDLQDQTGSSCVYFRKATAAERGKERVRKEGRAETGLVKRAEVHRDWRFNRSPLPQHGRLYGNPVHHDAGPGSVPQHPKTRRRYIILRSGPSKQDYEVCTSTGC